MLTLLHCLKVSNRKARGGGGGGGAKRVKCEVHNL